ncbi:unnamed protein product [Adineta steineri]|uniref:BRICHOS domain-containing protein n=1 Tax=Adineta steineri TaxID=433720 RepID=A0A818ZP62_9BILA|nr:unnamed protein product [Adineta steineri]CAF3775104.1 unnamed protein product [Adineta steineri]
MVGFLMNNVKKVSDKELVSPTKEDTIITIKGEQDDESISELEDVDRQGSSILFVSVIILLVITCLTISIWFSSEFISEINHKWHCTCQAQNRSVNKDLSNQVFSHHDALFAVNRGKKPIASTSIPLNIIQSEGQQQVIFDPEEIIEITETPRLSWTSTVRIINNFEHNITIIRNYNLSKCFIISFALQHIPETSNMYQKIFNSLFGSFTFNSNIISKAIKLQIIPLTENEIAQYGSEVITTCPIGIQTFRVVPKINESFL